MNKALRVCFVRPGLSSGELSQLLHLSNAAMPVGVGLAGMDSELALADSEVSISLRPWEMRC